MPKRAYIIPIVLCIILLLIAVSYRGMTTAYPAGRICIGDVAGELEMRTVPSCDCCPPLWGGGIATTTADLSAIREGDWATITLLDGTRLVLECAAILPCIRVGDWIVSQYGIFRAEGDVIVYDKYKAYMFVRM